MLGVVKKISEGVQIEEMNVKTLTKERKIKRPEGVNISKEI